jgi:two-component system response regulator QseB
MRILLVEDDRMIGAGLRAALRQAGLAADWVMDAPAAEAALAAESFELVLLDLGLPGRDGLALLQGLRARGDATPVIVVTARDALASRVAGLDAGADDYLVKPFELDELLARIHALERRRSGGATNQIRQKSLVLDLSDMTVSYEGKPVALQRREFMLLRKLIESPHQVFSRTQLEQSIYGWDADLESNTIDVHVHHLRRKLYGEVVKTVRGIGYRFGPR